VVEPLGRGLASDDVSANCLIAGLDEVQCWSAVVHAHVPLLLGLETAAAVD